VTFRPFLPSEFGQVTVILDSYVPEPDDKSAAARIAASYNKAVHPQNRHVHSW